MSDTNLTTSIQAIRTKILNDITTATVDQLLSLSRAAKSVGLTEDSDIENAVNSRVNALSSGATTEEMVKLSNAIKQVRNSSQSALSPSATSDDIVEGTTNKFMSDSNLQALGSAIIPATDATHDLGSPTNKFRDLYLDNNTLYFGTTQFTSDDILNFDLSVQPETLEIQVSADEAGHGTHWDWTWTQSALPYARTAITETPLNVVPLYMQGTYQINNFANTQYGSMTQPHSFKLKWIEGAGNDNLVSWATTTTVNHSHPDINGGNSTSVERLAVNVPSTITPPTLTAPAVTYTVSSTTGAYVFSGTAMGNNPEIGPFYRGGTYTININASGHPFYFTTDNGTNFAANTYFGEYTNGVTGSRTDNGTITFTVPAGAPDVLYYQCGVHGAMRGTIRVKDLAVETNANGNYLIYGQHTQESHAQTIELRPIPTLTSQMCLVYDSSTNKFVPQDLSTYVENTPAFENKIKEVAGTATLIAPDGTSLVASVNIYSDATYLPAVGNTVGDIAFVEDTQKLYIYKATGWIETVANADLTGLATEAFVQNYVANNSSGGGNVVEYTSTNTAATNDIVMLNSDGTVTVVEPTNYPFDQQTAIDSQMTSGSIADLNNRGMIAHHSTREKGMLIFPGGTGHNDRTMLVVFSRNGSGISKGTPFSSGEPINNFKDQHAFFGPAGAHEDKFLYLGAASSGGYLNVGTGNITGTTVNTTGTDSSAAYSDSTNNGQLDISINSGGAGNMAIDHGGFSGTVLTLYLKFLGANGYPAVRKFTYDFANQYLDRSFPEIELSTSEAFEWEHTAIDPSTPTRIALYRQEGSTSTRRGIIKFADVDWDAGTINIGPAEDLFTRSGSHNVDAYEIQNKQAFHPTNGLLAAVTTSPADGGGNAPYRLKVALYSADVNLSITNVSGNLTLMNGGNVKVGTVRGNIAWTKGSNTGSTPNAPILITPIISNQTGSSPQTRYLQYDNSGNYITQTTDSNTFDSGNMWTYSSPFNDGDTASYSPDTVNSQYPQVIMTQGPYGESNFDATKLHGVAASAGTTIDVTLEHGIHTGLSGLTTGTKYFVTDSGDISTSGSAKLGTAINATSLALDFTDELTSADLGTYATKSYVATQVANLVDAAPGALDTLNELAAALGDDANFSTTVTNSLANKADTSSLATVATSGSYNDLTNQPTIPTNNNQLTNGAGFITAADVSNSSVVEYTSTTSASINDVVMLNTDGTVTPVETITYTDSISLGGEYLVQENNGWSSSSTDVTNSLSIASRPGRIFPTGIDNKFILAGYDGISTNNQEAVAVIDWTGSQWSYGQKYVVGTEMGGNSSYFSVAEQSAPFILGSLVNTSKFLYFQKRQEAFSGGQYTGDFAYGFGTISGSTISWTSATDTGFGYDSTWNEKIIYDFAGSSTGNYKFIIMYTRDSGSGTQLRLVRGTWDGTSNSVSFSNEITISRGIDPRGVGFSSITEGRFAAVSGSLNGGPQAGDLEIFDVDWDNGTYTVGNAVTPASIYTGSSMPAKVAWNPTNDTFVVAWLVGGSGGSNVDNLRYRTYEANGTTPSTYGSERNFGEDRFEFANGDFTFLSGSSTLVHTYIRQFTQFSSTHDAGYIRSMNVASNGNITNNQETQTSNLGNYGSASHVRDNGWRYEGRIVVDPHRKGMGTRLDPRTNNSTADVSKWVGMNIRGDFVESSLDATKLHGIAASSGTTIDVSVDGSIHNQLTGLIADQVYYVLEDGTLSTTPDTHNARIGVSLSNTAIKVSLSEKLTSADLGTYATETYVTTQVANLVDTAPGALDTLNELAAALGDDANFSTTVTNSIATKADTSSLATVATSGSYNDLSNKPTIPTAIDQTANVLSGASPQIDLTKNYFKIDLSSDTTFSTTGSPTNGEWYEGKIEVKGNASQLTHNLVTNPSNQISNWRTTTSTPSISGFYSQGYSVYGFFAVSPNGQYAINGSYVGTGDYRFQIIEFSTPGDITSGSLVHQSGNVHGTISWQRSNVYFATNTKFVTSSGHVITVPSGSITTSNPYGSLPNVDTAGQGNWSSDGTKYIGVKEAQNQDPIFKLYTASTPFYANTLTLTQSYTFNKWSIGGDHSLKIDHGNNVHISDDGLNLYTAGYYQLNNWSNQMMMHFTLSTAFDLSTMSHTGNNLTGSYATFGHGRFIEGGAQYWAPKSNGVYGFQNLNTPAVLNTTTWPGTWSWEGGISHSAPPNNETDIINFSSTDGGSTFNAWVEKDSDKSAGFDGQYSSLTGAPTLATVATSGSYNDLSNQPTIPSISGLATETYVNTATANLVDSAPATLDTLNELAAALGDDANFSTTITNQIAAKADAYSIATVTASGGNFYIDGVQQVTLSFEPGRTYRFDQADSSNGSHPLRFSTTSDGTHGGGSEYTTGVTTNGTAGSAGAYVQIAITNATPTLYYYCVNHSGMGAGSVVGNFSGNYNDLTNLPTLFDGQFSSLTGTPSLYTDSAVDTHLNISGATTGQILSWNGTDYAWIDAAAGGGSSVSVSATAPSSPSEGDLWFDEDDLVMYVWYTDGDSSQWIEANSVTAAAATIHASDTAPSGPSSGDLWFNTTLLDLYVYYADGDSNQWVQVGGAANSQTSGSGGGSSVQSLIETANTSVTTTDTGTDGHIDFTTNGTARWEITSNGHILPHTNASFDIGSAEKKVRYLFLDSNTMFVGDTSFSEDNIDRSMEVYTDQSAPSSSTDEGKKGDVRIVGNYMYVCINTNEWIRTQIEKDW